MPKAGALGLRLPLRGLPEPSWTQVASSARVRKEPGKEEGKETMAVIEGPVDTGPVCVGGLFPLNLRGLTVRADPWSGFQAAAAAHRARKRLLDTATTAANKLMP